MFQYTLLEGTSPEFDTQYPHCTNCGDPLPIWPIPSDICQICEYEAANEDLANS